VATQQWTSQYGIHVVVDSMKALPRVDSGKDFGSLEAEPLSGLGQKV
jgi:hypothetical protein